MSDNQSIKESLAVIKKALQDENTTNISDDNSDKLEELYFIPLSIPNKGGKNKGFFLYHQEVLFLPLQ